MSSRHAGFFEKYPKFYGTGNTGAGVRLNARYECLIQQHSQHIKDQTVLDVGSHDGRWTFAALSAGAKRAIGVEPRPCLAETATETLLEYGTRRERFEFHNTDALDLLRRARLNVDTVFLFGVFYHIHYHVELLKELWKTGARAIIVDTHTCPDREGPKSAAGWFGNVISLIPEQVDNISNAADEIFPGAKISIVGHPSARAVTFLLRAFQFEPSEIPWQPFLDKWGKEGLEDYASGKRRTYLAVRTKG
jgi:hypothetical protein